MINNNSHNSNTNNNSNNNVIFLLVGMAEYRTQSVNWHGTASGNKV